MTRRIQTTNPNERAFRLPWMEDELEWDDDQTAAVDADVADRLVEERADISYAEADADRCTVELSSGDECGRERPCQYHDDTGDDE